MTLMVISESQAIYRKTDLVDLARTGIETKYLREIQQMSSLTDKELSEILPISQRQLQRYAADHKLNKAITAHLIQLVDLFQKGFKLFGEDKFKQWIRKENKVLNNYTPVELMDTSIGIEMIEDVIGRIEHGVYS